jgi:hypothetical protein
MLYPSVAACLVLGLFVGCGHGSAPSDTSRSTSKRAAAEHSISDSAAVRDARDRKEPELPPLAVLLNKRPLAAIWRDSGRFVEGPALRVAVWEDGYVLFPEEPRTRSHGLLLGRIPQTEVNSLKREIEKTGLMELQGHCYLHLDVPAFCMMASIDDRQQMLYWDELDVPGRQPRHVKFAQAWRAVNDILSAHFPSASTAVPSASIAIPKSWYLREAVESE